MGHMDGGWQQHMALFLPSSLAVADWPCLHAEADDDTALYYFPCSSSSRSHEQQITGWGCPVTAIAGCPEKLRF